jgi:RNA polymerase sigma factor (sigma-70 family)
MAEWLWEEFYRRFDPRIRIYVRRSWRQRLSNSNDLRISEEITADLTQNVYVRLLSDERQALRDFKGLTDISFLAYLARIATNIVAEYFRTLLAGKRHAATLSVEYLLDERHISQNYTQDLIYQYLSENPESQYVEQILLLEIRQLMQEGFQGPNVARDQRILELYFMEGLPIPQIAALIGPSLKTRSIESVIRRAQRRLFRQLQLSEKMQLSEKNRGNLSLISTTSASNWDSRPSARSGNDQFHHNRCLTNKSTNESTNKSSNEPTNKSINKSINKSTNKPINRPINKPIADLADRLTSSLTESLNYNLTDAVIGDLAEGLSLELKNDLVTAWIN